MSLCCIPSSPFVWFTQLQLWISKTISGCHWIINRRMTIPPWRFTVTRIWLGISPPKKRRSRKPSHNAVSILVVVTFGMWIDMMDLWWFVEWELGWKLKKIDGWKQLHQTIWHIMTLIASKGTHTLPCSQLVPLAGTAWSVTLVVATIVWRLSHQPRKVLLKIA